jgi:hypothetical protein
MINYHGTEKVEREKSGFGIRGSGLGKAIGNRHKGTEGIADCGMRIKKT